MMMIDNKYEIGDIVYLKTDPDQQQQIVIAIHVYKAAELMYKLAAGSDTSVHYDFEISDTVNEQIKLANL